MRIFVSYASEEATVAERISFTLPADGHNVFFDKSSLPEADEFDSRIRRAITRCDLFIFLISPASVERGTYALTELDIASRRWLLPAGSILPVMVRKTQIETIPPVLRAVTILQPSGEVVAEVAAAVARIKPSFWRPRIIAIPLVLVGLALAISVALSTLVATLNLTKRLAELGRIGWNKSTQGYPGEFILYIFPVEVK